jgi:tungstate transport system ATP-binding protein
MRLRGFQEDEITARARRWLERFGISGLAGRQVATLSGGEAQRVSLARAFSMEPEVIFLDEPFAALDAPTRQSLLFEMGAVLKETGATAVLVTHDRDEALALGDRAAVLIQGGIAQTGRPGEIFSSPADEAVAAFVGVENVLSGDISRQRDGIATVTLSDGITIEAVSGLPAGTPVSACLRPEDITLSLAGNPTASSARNRVVGKVSGLLPAGAQTRVRISGAINLNAQITTRSCQEMDLKQETPVAASFKATSVHLIPRI